MTVPHGLMFHRFHKSGTRSRGQGSLTEVDLERILKSVGPSRILHPEEWLARVRTRTLRDGDLCITFDDGLRSQFDVAIPVLDRCGLKAFWFIYSSVFDGGINRSEVYSYFATVAYPSFEAFTSDFFGAVGLRDSVFDGSAFRDYASSLRRAYPFYSEADIRYRFVRNRLPHAEFERTMDGIMDSHGVGVADLAQGLWLENEQLALLAETGHVIGLHSYDHPFDIARLPAEEQKRQYERNYDHVAYVTGRRPESMSHPLTSYSPTTLRVLSDMGIVCGFRSNMTPPDQRGLNPTSLELGREDGSSLVPR